MSKNSEKSNEIKKHEWSRARAMDLFTENFKAACEIYGSKIAEEALNEINIRAPHLAVQFEQAKQNQRDAALKSMAEI